jgi:predicted RecA/RadA family phage recombinase
MPSTYVGPARVYNIAAPSALVSGDVISYAGKAAVYTGLKGAASGDLVAVTTEGQFSFPSASATTFAVGAAVYWDISEEEATAAASGDFLLGFAVLAKVDGQTSVLVALNEFDNLLVS